MDKYPREYLLGELKRVAIICGKIPSMVEFDKHSSLASVTLAKRFKGWKGALESAGFDYIEIDPFGSPTDFLESSIVRLSRRGILAVTATDTAPLCGTYPNTCKRKYSYWLPLQDALRTFDWKGLRQKLDLSGIMQMLKVQLV